MTVYVLFHFWWSFTEEGKNKLIGVFSELSKAKEHAEGVLDSGNWFLTEGQWVYTIESTHSSGSGFTIYECPLNSIVNFEPL